MVNIKDKLKAQVALNSGILIISLVAILIAEGIKVLLSKEPFSFGSFINGCSNADLIFAIFTAECTNICWRFLDQDKIGFTADYLLYMLLYCLIVVAAYVAALVMENDIPQVVQWIFFGAALCYIFDTRIIYKRMKAHNSKLPVSQSAGYPDVKKEE